MLKQLKKVEKQNIPAEFYRIIGFIKQIIFKSKIKVITFVNLKGTWVTWKREEGIYLFFF